MIQCRFGDYDTYAEYGCHSNSYQHVLEFQERRLVRNLWGQSIVKA